MFLFNSFKFGNSGSFRGSLARGVFVISVLLSLGAGLLFTGCDKGGDDFRNDKFIPVGVWSDGFGGHYIITNFTLEYHFPEMEWEGEVFPGGTMKGDILIANDFSPNSGVLLIEITDSDIYGFTVGKFTCVYYRDYTPSHVLLANPIDEFWAYIEKDTLAEAESLFTADNVGTHVQNWGSGYSK